MKIITFSAIKGGVGKTTLTYNFGSWLKYQGKKVLYIDLDHQCNLTQTFNIFENKGTVADIFIPKNEVNIIKIDTHISIIPGYMRLDDIEKNISTQSNKDMLFYMWLEDNYQKMNINEYDFILIDTHPDFSTITKNAIAISHTVFSPVTPSEHGFSSRDILIERFNEFKNEMVDFKTRESYITADLFFIANMVKHNTKSSKEFMKLIPKIDDVIAVIPNKELFNNTTLEKKSITEMSLITSQYNKHKKFFDNYHEININLLNHIKLRKEQ
ncbi:ParA family protein [Macrococcoides caseolyticum]|uniref:Peptide transporter n=1 Tax=Macrococcoides caseolyticum TaxID=69966 RepID=A0ACC9MPG8_9STAP|nr:AAA family ATPase [Macrococcus caseolyticus]PKE38403.1 peptide transporter [Macrococcus caseolyticus]PKE55548.1 peptide transporter [Macrococcus caseolyticus]PKF39953.1 peptide transporter [Macrococcus caseolyticus]QYA36605.1 AAA family ATPase [Macrococcus caseolyticus]